MQPCAKRVSLFLQAVLFVHWFLFEDEIQGGLLRLFERASLSGMQALFKPPWQFEITNLFEHLPLCVTSCDSSHKALPGLPTSQAPLLESSSRTVVTQRKELV